MVNAPTDIFKETLARKDLLIAIFASAAEERWPTFTNKRELALQEVLDGTLTYIGKPELPENLRFKSSTIYGGGAFEINAQRYFHTQLVGDRILAPTIRRDLAHLTRFRFAAFSRECKEVQGEFYDAFESGWGMGICNQPLGEYFILRDELISKAAKTISGLSPRAQENVKGVSNAMIKYVKRDLAHGRLGALRAYSNLILLK